MSDPSIEPASDARRRRLAVYQDEIRGCTRCRGEGLLHVDAAMGSSYPVLQRDPTGDLRILIVGEAPNQPDTFDADKRRLTYDADTDESGKFMRKLLVEVVGLDEGDLAGLMFTNAVACLPKRKGERYPVGAKQLTYCRDWLVRLLEAGDPTVVVAMGAKALHALGRVERHGLRLASAVGRMHTWSGRNLLPIYHPGSLGRINRRAELQRQDIVPLRDHVRALRTLVS